MMWNCGRRVALSRRDCACRRAWIRLLPLLGPISMNESCSLIREVDRGGDLENGELIEPNDDLRGGVTEG